MKRNWKELSRGDTRPQWSGIYVTMNGKGRIVMNRAAYKRLGEPEAFTVLFDAANNSIGLRPTSHEMRNAYPAAPAGRHGGRRISAYRLLKEYSLRVPQTLIFPDADIDEDGILVLDLRTAEVSNRVRNHPRRRRSEK
jgi:hypothetical protein